MFFLGHTVTLLINLYRRQKAKVRREAHCLVGFEQNVEYNMNACSCHTCLISMAEMTMREVLKGYEGGFQIGVRRVTNLRYAYDLAGLLRNTVTTVDVST